MPSRRTQFARECSNARAATRVTADTLIQNGWFNSWIDGVRRWHHNNLPAHFKSLEEAKALYLKYQQPTKEKTEDAALA